ncbi:MAG: hypothetical protein SGARI_007185, partial [Bacillariaceae sp.]
MLKDYSMQRLKLPESKLYGRDHEVSTLKSLLQDKLTATKASASKQEDQRQGRCFVTIRGTSGTGKSALAASLKQQVQHVHKGYFIMGKFDLQTSNAEPFSALKEAMTQLVEQLLDRVHTAEEGNLIQHAIQKEMGTISA